MRDAYEIGMNPITKLFFSKFEQDAGECFSDLLDYLSQETKEIELTFSAVMKEIGGRCERYIFCLKNFERSYFYDRIYFYQMQKKAGFELCRNTIEMVAHGVGNRHTLKQSLAKYLTMDEYCCDCKAQTYKSIKKFSHLSRYTNYLTFSFKSFEYLIFLNLYPQIRYLAFVLLRTEFEIPLCSDDILDLKNWVTDSSKSPTTFLVYAKICHRGTTHEKGFSYKNHWKYCLSDFLKLGYLSRALCILLFYQFKMDLL